jgi:hypothetical protein
LEVLKEHQLGRYSWEEDADGSNEKEAGGDGTRDMSDLCPTSCDEDWVLSSV